MNESIPAIYIAQDWLYSVLGSQDTNQDIGVTVLCSTNLNIEFLKLFWHPA